MKSFTRSVVLALLGLGLAGYAARGGASYITIAAILVATALVLWIARWLASVPPAETQADHFPHCKVGRTAQGFVNFYFNRIPLQVYRSLGVASDKETGALAALFNYAGAGLIAVASLIFGGTNIQIETVSVVIGWVRLNRRDLTGFSLVTYKIPGIEDDMAVLCYRYGRKVVKFGGAWKQHEAEEIASALNSYLRAIPAAHDAGRISAEQLRETRPAEF